MHNPIMYAVCSRMNGKKIILATILLIIALIYIQSIRNKEDYRYLNKRPDRISKIPKFERTDIFGKPIYSNEFERKNLYIQFIDAKYELDIKLFDEVYKACKNKELQVLIFLNDFNFNEINYLG